MRNIVLATLTCGIAAACFLYVLPTATSLAELELLTELQVKKIYRYVKSNQSLSAEETAKLSADLYQQLNVSSPQQLQRQLEAMLQAAATTTQQNAEVNIYLKKALELEQNSSLASDNFGALLFTRAKLRKQLRQQPEAIHFFKSAISQLDNTKHDQLLIGEALNYICQSQIELGEYQPAEQWCEQFAKWASQSEYATALQQSDALELLATLNLKLNTSNPEKAKALYIQSIRLRRLHNFSLTNSLMGLASAYSDLNNMVFAENTLQEAFETMREDITTSSDEKIQLLHHIAEIQDSQGNFESALHIAQQALSLLETNQVDNETLRAAILNQLGSVSQSLGQFEPAKSYYLASLNSFEILVQGNNPNTASVLNNLGSIFSALDDYEMSKYYYQQALSMRKAVYGNKHIEVVITQQNLALVYWNLKQLPEAKQLLEDGLTSINTLDAFAHPVSDVLAVNLGRLYSEMNDPRAEALLKNALVSQQNKLGSSHIKLLPTLYGLASHYRKNNQLTDAEILYTRALTIAEKTLPPNHSDISACLYSLGRVNQLQGDYAAAEKFYKKELDILKKRNSSKDEINGTLKHLVTVLEELGKTGEANATRLILHSENSAPLNLVD